MKLLFSILLMISGFQVTILYASAKKMGIVIEAIDDETEDVTTAASTTSASASSSSSASTSASMSAQSSASSSAVANSISAAAAAAAPKRARAHFHPSEISGLNDALTSSFSLMALENAARGDKEGTEAMVKLLANLKKIDPNTDNVGPMLDVLTASKEELDKITKKNSSQKNSKNNKN